MAERLALLGVGADLPPAVDIAAFVKSAGGDPVEYRGWSRGCHALPQDHPSDMGERALSRALVASGVAAEDLDLVVYCGTSRDYPASWSVSTEIMARCGVGPQAIGIDTMAACLATLASIEFVDGWLKSRRGGHAAVIAAERWSQTVDFADRKRMGLWGHADGATASVWGLNSSHQAKFEYVGSAFANAAQNNNFLRVAYGGTRAPVAPPGVDPNLRVVQEKPREYIVDLYQDGYRRAYAALRERFDLNPAHLVCNQTTPGMVAWLANEFGLADSVTITGDECGHLGGSDILLGIESLIEAGDTHETVLLVASAPYGFGAGYLVAPTAP